MDAVFDSVSVATTFRESLAKVGVIFCPISEAVRFGGRVLGDDKPKYLNSPETPVFSKGRELYGLFEARSSPHEEWVNGGWYKS